MVPFDYGWKIHEYEAMIKFFDPSAFIIEEREETQNARDLIADRLKPNRLLAIAANRMQHETAYEEAIAASAPDDPGVEVDGRDTFLIMITSEPPVFQGLCH